ncbi:hypothetical protein L596_022046 [Steinernema carpocapsae]|uniref:Serpin domain-containing protein n=1 Tax=Steinernema carpocapsae TaxID=34508 RepID=A0A4U5MKM8_STECR|nr:hypothetical protein L596_022046 [Steinernema carpocapsae]
MKKVNYLCKFGREDHNYHETKDVKILRMTYRTSPNIKHPPSPSAMYVFLPTTFKPIQTLFDGFDEAKKEREIDVNQIPKFELELQHKVGDVLKQLGMKTAFDEAADLSRMATDKPMFIDTFTQNVFISTLTRKEQKQQRSRKLALM